MTRHANSFARHCTSEQLVKGQILWVVVYNIEHCVSCFAHCELCWNSMLLVIKGQGSMRYAARPNYSFVARICCQIIVAELLESLALMGHQFLAPSDLFSRGWLKLLNLQYKPQRHRRIGWHRGRREGICPESAISKPELRGREAALGPRSDGF